MADSRPTTAFCRMVLDHVGEAPSPEAAVVLIHAAATELCRLHLGRFPVLRGRLQRDADSARDFAARMSAVPRTTERVGGELTLATGVFLRALLVGCREFAARESIRMWSVDDARSLEVCSLARRARGHLEPFRGHLAGPEPAVNTVICLAQRTLFLLERRSRRGRPLMRPPRDRAAGAGPTR